MTDLADVDGFKIYIQACVLLSFRPLIHPRRSCGKTMVVKGLRGRTLILLSAHSPIKCLKTGHLSTPSESPRETLFSLSFCVNTDGIPVLCEQQVNGKLLLKEIAYFMTSNEHPEWAWICSPNYTVWDFRGCTYIAKNIHTYHSFDFFFHWIIIVTAWIRTEN